MITSVRTGKSGRKNKTFYKVMTESKNGTIREYRYDNTNVPKTVLAFIETTPFQHVGKCLLFR
jgi:hypothetical protein